MGNQYLVFYAKDVPIAGRNPIWIQGTLLTLMWMFERFVLYTNLGNNKAMTCTPIFKWGHMVQYKYKRQAMVEGTTF